MYLLKLFHRSDPEQAIQARMTPEGVMTVGRDAASDWVISDPDCEISRHHLELHLFGGRLTLRPLGANGIFLGDSPDKLSDATVVPLSVGDRFRFGKYSMLVDACPFAEHASEHPTRTMIFPAPLERDAEIPMEWSDLPEPTFDDREPSLLEAFCAGAGLDASAFSAEDPTEIMREAGAVYRQMVLGLSVLMEARTDTRTQFGLDRTTISAGHNNIFKWAPSQKLAIDLLVKKDDGFMFGAAAIRDSIGDLRKHLVASLSGYRAALAALLDTFDPDKVRSGVQKSNLLQSRDAAAWQAFQAVHHDLKRQFEGQGAGPVSRAFVEGYEAEMRELNRKPRK